MCSRGSSEDTAASEGEDAWEGPYGRLLLATTATVKRGRRRQARQLHLYANVLLISSSKFESNFTIKHSVPLRSLWVSAYLERSRRATSRDRRSLVLGWPRNSFVVTFSSVQQKQEWHSCLESCMVLANDRDQPGMTPQDTLPVQREDGACEPFHLEQMTSETSRQLVPNPRQQGRSQQGRGVLADGRGSRMGFRGNTRNSQPLGTLLDEHSFSIMYQQEATWQQSLFMQMRVAPVILRGPSTLALGAAQCPPSVRVRRDRGACSRPQDSSSTVLRCSSYSIFTGVTGPIICVLAQHEMCLTSKDNETPDTVMGHQQDCGQEMGELPTTELLSQRPQDSTSVFIITEPYDLEQTSEETPGAEMSHHLFICLFRNLSLVGHHHIHINLRSHLLVQTHYDVKACVFRHNGNNIVIC
ncbi:uncharacterized protein LOC132539438 isoform X2 [Erinaceus europaeus]|uniref:Uncharacterized protein LOC132539438 isoform X2 n=1 Tax=Erinaceus europaeus TaxID=9365 RepID=A0ABM3XPC4_ERIEU|nr:uncharacterized protein LOC132539438 isoform X2 [Erinaceus europaeus]